MHTIFTFVIYSFLTFAFCSEPLHSQEKTLLEKLHALHHSDLHPSQALLWEVHKEWIEPLITFTRTYQNGVVEYPKDTSHPIFFFDRTDARFVLKPLFKKTANFELTDELIHRVFLEKIPFCRDNHKSTSIDFFQTEQVKNESFKIAKKAFEITQGQILFVLGQTPGYVGEMIKAIDAELKGNIAVMNIPFSGRPDYTRKVKYRSLWSTAFLDLVSDEGRTRFLNLISQKGFSPQTWKLDPKKIFILDNSSGASVSCFLTLLKNWFEKEGVAFPEMTFLHMCKQDDFGSIDVNGKWHHLEKPDLCFSEHTTFDIPVIFLGMDDDILVAFDKMYDNLRLVPSYNGIFWSKPYLETFFTEYPTKEAKKLIKEYHDFAVEQLLPR